MFGLGRLFYLVVLVLNAAAILNEERFLARLIGDEAPSFGPPQETVKTRVISLVRAIRTVMRPFLIAFNVFIVVYELVLG